MKIFKYPVKLVDAFIDRVVGVIGAISASQIPGFVQHYLQRLGGHVDEARRVAQGWQEIADKTQGGSIDKLLEHYRALATDTTLETAKKCVSEIRRFEDLQAALKSISEASPWTRPLAYLRHMDGDITRATWDTYTANVPVDPPSLVYALAGLLLAVLLYKLLKLGCRAGWNAAARKRANKRAAKEFEKARAEAEHQIIEQEEASSEEDEEQ